MAVLGPVDWDGRCLSPGCGTEDTGPNGSPSMPLLPFCFLYASVVVNHQHRGLLLCLSTYPGCSVQIVLWGPYWLAPG